MYMCACHHDVLRISPVQAHHAKLLTVITADGLTRIAHFAGTAPLDTLDDDTVPYLHRCTGIRPGPDHGARNFVTGRDRVCRLTRLEVAEGSPE